MALVGPWDLGRFRPIGPSGQGSQGPQACCSGSEPLSSLGPVTIPTKNMFRYNYLSNSCHQEDRKFLTKNTLGRSGGLAVSILTTFTIHNLFHYNLTTALNVLSFFDICLYFIFDIEVLRHIKGYFVTRNLKKQLNAYNTCKLRLAER